MGDLILREFLPFFPRINLLRCLREIVFGREKSEFVFLGRKFQKNHHRQSRSFLRFFEKVLKK